MIIPTLAKTGLLSGGPHTASTSLAARSQHPSRLGERPRRLDHPRHRVRRDEPYAVRPRGLLGEHPLSQQRHDLDLPVGQVTRSREHRSLLGPGR
jgi:hypothetical protein